MRRGGIGQVRVRHLRSCFRRSYWGHVDFDTAPEKINQDAYGAWIFKLKPANESEWASLLDAEAYQKLIEAQVA